MWKFEKLCQTMPAQMKLKREVLKNAKELDVLRELQNRIRAQKRSDTKTPPPV